MKSINYAQAKNFLEQDNITVLIDVRNKEEYNTKHFPKAILIPLNEIEYNICKIIPNKNTRIILYCKAGVRSLQAGEILERLGYKEVYNIANGILELNEM